MATLFYWNSAGILDLGPDPIIFTVSRETPQFKDASPIGANRFLVDDFGGEKKPKKQPAVYLRALE